MLLAFRTRVIPTQWVFALWCVQDMVDPNLYLQQHTCFVLVMRSGYGGPEPTPAAEHIVFSCDGHSGHGGSKTVPAAVHAVHIHLCWWCVRDMVDLKLYLLQYKKCFFWWFVQDMMDPSLYLQQFRAGFAAVALQFDMGQIAALYSSYKMSMMIILILIICKLASFNCLYSEKVENLLHN